MGHRLYNDSDVQLVERIRTLPEEGHALSAIVRQTLQRSDLVEPVRRVPEASGVWSDYLADTLRAVHALSQANGARIICACLPGSQHEFGLMLFAISASMRNYRVLYLGADLPLDSMPTVINRSGSRCVVLSATTKMDRARQRLLAGLLSRIQVPLQLGGHGSNQLLPLFERAGGVRLGSRIGVALQVLGSHVPASGAGESGGRNSW